GPDGTPVTEVPSDNPEIRSPAGRTGTDVEQAPELTETKVVTSTGPYSAAGDEITYDIVVTNTGNVTIDNIVLTDDNAELVNPGEENIGTLAPAESRTIAVTHTVTQDDLDAGSVSNQALVNGNGPDGTPVTEVPSDNPDTPDSGDPTDTDMVRTPSFILVKALISVNGNSATTDYRAVGDELAYAITITNTGNVTLSNVVVNDALTRLSESIPTLALGATETFRTTYTVTQADLDYGSVLNVATATGEDPDGDPVAPVDPATVTVDADQTPIVADDDTPPTINGYEGGTTDESVLENDLLGGTSVDPGEITLNVDGSEVTAPVPFDDGEGNPVTGIVMNPDGTVTVSPGTPAGEYTLDYTICEVLNTSNCEGATVTITVTPGVIEATDDTPPAINGKDGGTTPRE